MKKQITVLLLMLVAFGTSMVFAQGNTPPADPNLNYNDFSTLQGPALIRAAKTYNLGYLNVIPYTFPYSSNDISLVRNNPSLAAFSVEGGGVAISYAPLQNSVRVANASYAQQVGDHSYIYGYLDLKGAGATNITPTVPRYVEGTSTYGTFSNYDRDLNAGLGYATKPFDDERFGIAANAIVMQSNPINGAIEGKQDFNAYSYGVSMSATYANLDEYHNGTQYSLNLNNIGITSFRYASDNKRYMPAFVSATAQYQAPLASGDQFIFGGMLGKELSANIPNPDNQSAVRQYDSYHALGSLIHPNAVWATSVNAAYSFNFENNTSAGIHVSYTQDGAFSIPVTGLSYRLGHDEIVFSYAFNNSSLPTGIVSRFNFGIHVTFADMKFFQTGE